MDSRRSAFDNLVLHSLYKIIDLDAIVLDG